MCSKIFVLVEKDFDQKRLDIFCKKGIFQYLPFPTQTKFGEQIAITFSILPVQTRERGGVFQLRLLIKSSIVNAKIKPGSGGKTMISTFIRPFNIIH